MRKNQPGRATADERYVALAVASRRRLLDALREAGTPLDVGQLASTVGLHVTTARFHLDVLERADLVTRLRETPTGPGRPRQLYQLREQAGAEPDRELLHVLSGMLDEVAGRSGAQVAEAAGQRWAEERVREPEDLPWEEAVRRLGVLFGQLGFGPSTVDTADGCQVRLAACPFREVARAHPAVVCGVHRGLLRGALSRWGLTSIAAETDLRPFVEPELCIADIPRPSSPEEGSSPTR